MTSLHDRLADLAEDAPTPATDPGLWDVARRYHRRRRAGAAVLAAAVVVALLGAAGAVWPSATGSLQPAAPATPSALPSRVVDPSPWLPTSAAPGPLALVMQAEQRSWTGSDWGSLVGVSATTGAYTFLDLPGRASDVASGITAQVALSPSGRWLAYWTADGDTSADRHPDGLTGLAAVDLETGRVVRQEVTSPHGISPWDLAWADDETVVASWGDIDAADASSSRNRLGVQLWTPTSNSGPSPIGPVRGRTAYQVEDTPGDGSVLLGVRGFVLVDTADLTDTDRYVVPGIAGAPDEGVLGTPRLSPDHDHLTLIDGADDRLAVAEVSPGSRTDAVVVPSEVRVYETYGWSGDDHVVVAGDPEGADGLGGTLRSIDVRTGEAETLVRLDSFVGTEIALARDLLAVPPVERPDPPSPWDPRVAAGAALLGVLVAAGALVWRRRARV
ncbi:MAG: hypothetical protein CMH83_01135 [Nocardioides sp.]|nr:hypothetical protein [Nocardioides sp.]